MKRTASIVLIVTVIAATAYLFLTRTAVAPTQDTTALPAAQAVTISTSTLAEEGADYSVNVEYPQFGILSIDAQIRDVVVAAAEELKKQAAIDTPVSQGFRKYEFMGAYNSVYTGPDIVSFREVLAQDTGGAHPLPVVYGLNFDARSGKMLTLEDALRLTGLSLEQLSVQAKEKLTALSYGQYFGEGGLFADGVTPIQENYKTFVIGKDSVTFIFQPYQVAPYSAGTPEVIFPRK